GSRREIEAGTPERAAELHDPGVHEVDDRGDDLRLGRRAVRDRLHQFEQRGLECHGTDLPSDHGRAKRLHDVHPPYVPRTRSDDGRYRDAPRTRRPGRRPVGAPPRMITWPATSVAT